MIGLLGLEKQNWLGEYGAEMATQFWVFSKMSEIKKLCDWLIKTSPVDQLFELLPSPSPATVLCQIYF